MRWLAQALDTDLKEEVYLPIDKWHSRYKVIKVCALPCAALPCPALPCPALPKIQG